MAFQVERVASCCGPPRVWVFAPDKGRTVFPVQFAIVVIFLRRAVEGADDDCRAVLAVTLAIGVIVFLRRAERVIVFDDCRAILAVKLVIAVKIFFVRINTSGPGLIHAFGYYRYVRQHGHDSCPSIAVSLQPLYPGTSFEFVNFKGFGRGFPAPARLRAVFCAAGRHTPSPGHFLLLRAWSRTRKAEDGISRRQICKKTATKGPIRRSALACSRNRARIRKETGRTCVVYQLVERGGNHALPFALSLR